MWYLNTDERNYAVAGAIALWTGVAALAIGWWFLSGVLALVAVVSFYRANQYRRRGTHGGGHS